MRFDVPEVIEAKMKIPQRMMLEDVGFDVGVHSKRVIFRVQLGKFTLVGGNWLPFGLFSH